MARAFLFDVSFGQEKREGEKVSFGNGNGNGEIVISTPLRTAIGTFGGALKDTPAVDLGATVGAEVLQQAGVEGEQVDQIIVGNILSAGQGMNPGRQVGMKAGLPVTTPGMTLNRMCGSGLQAIVSAAQEVALGDADVVMAGGIENMDRAPFLLDKARYGYRMGMPSAEMFDHMVYDGLWDVFNDYHMGVTAENVAEEYGITREDSDAYAVSGGLHRDRAAAHGFDLREGQFEEQQGQHRAARARQRLHHVGVVAADGALAAHRILGGSDGGCGLVVGSGELDVHALLQGGVHAAAHLAQPAGCLGQPWRNPAARGVGTW